VDNQENPTGPTPDDMRDMLGLLDSLSGRDSDGDEPDLDLLGGSNDRLAL
jgi:hypothetical protein